MYGLTGHSLGKKKRLGKVVKVPLKIPRVYHLLKCLWNLLPTMLHSLLWLPYLPSSFFPDLLIGGASSEDSYGGSTWAIPGSQYKVVGLRFDCLESTDSQRGPRESVTNHEGNVMDIQPYLGRCAAAS